MTYFAFLQGAKAGMVLEFMAMCFHCDEEELISQTHSTFEEVTRLTVVMTRTKDKIRIAKESVR
jgi:hypothetical protein